MTDITKEIEEAAEKHEPSHDLEMCIDDKSVEGVHNAVVDAYTEGATKFYQRGREDMMNETIEILKAQGWKLVLKPIEEKGEIK